MNRVLSVVCAFTILLIFSGCAKNTPEIYTVSNRVGQKTIVCYGVVECSDVISVSYPSNSKNITEKFDSGELIHKGDVISEYTVNDTVKNIIAEHDGIICAKEKSTEKLKYYNMNELIISAQISETDAHYIDVGMTVTISGTGFDENEYSGTVSKVNSLAKHTENGSFLTFEVKINDPDNSILPGFTAKIKTISVIEGSVVVPISAIGYDEDGYFVKKIENGQPKSVKVEGTLLSAGSFAVYKGINTNDKIIMDISQSEE